MRGPPLDVVMEAQVVAAQAHALWVAVAPDVVDVVNFHPSMVEQRLLEACDRAPVCPNQRRHILAT